MNNILKSIFLAIIVSISIAQISVKSTPKSLLFDNINQNVPNINLNTIDIEALLIEDEIEQMNKNIPFRFGTPIEVNYNLDNSGEWIEH